MNVRLAARRVGPLAAALLLFVLLQPAGAAGEYEQRDNILITSNSQFNAENGVRSGTGRASDPYVISGWEVRNIQIKDTSAHIIIEDNHVTGRMVLDWVGPGVAVRRNQVGDLRVNQNVPRTGEPTAGRFARNTFGVVGQLRHFDGVFEGNKVTGTNSMVLFGQPLAVNFDGFNGARFRNNSIRGGYVSVRLHGHHHGSSFEDSSHNHSHEHDDSDHTSRFHRVWIENNEIHAPGCALIYTDSGHGANDTTAASEQNEALREPHIHHTRVYLTGNRLFGGGICSDFFNARGNHIGTSRGLLVIKNNRINFGRYNDMDPLIRYQGIHVRESTDVDLRIVGNRVTGPGLSDDIVRGTLMQDDTAGIVVQSITGSRVFLYDNVVNDSYIGIEARRFQDTSLHLRNFKTRGVSERMRRDNTVP